MKQKYLLFFLVVLISFYGAMALGRGFSVPAEAGTPTTSTPVTVVAQPKVSPMNTNHSTLIICLLAAFVCLVLLVYSIMMCRRNADETSLLMRHIRRIYYTLWLIFSSGVVLYAHSAGVQLLGSNILGLPPELSLAIVLLVMGVLVDVLIITATSFKSITIGNVKYEAADLNAAISTNLDAATDLSKKVEAQYQVIDFVTSGAMETPQTITLADYFKRILDMYLSTQKEKNQSIEVVELIDNEFDETVQKYKLTENEKGILERGIEDLFISQFQHREWYMLVEWYMFIPYQCKSANTKMLIVLRSKAKIIQAESYLLLGIVSSYEDYLFTIGLADDDDDATNPEEQVDAQDKHV
jgi:hypothetical protein